MQIKLHGMFAEDYPDDYFIEAETVADAIAGWSTQVGFYTDRMMEMRPLVRVVDFDTDISLYEKTEQKVIHLVPAMVGGGGKFGQILVGAALIVAGVLLVTATTVTGLGLAAGGALIGAGIGMVLGGVMAFFNKSPSLSQSNDPPASKYLGLSDNTTAIGTPISIDYGRRQKFGHVLALNIDSSNMVTGAFPSTPT